MMKGQQKYIHIYLLYIHIIIVNVKASVTIEKSNFAVRASYNYILMIFMTQKQTHKTSVSYGNKNRGNWIFSQRK